MGIYFMKTFWWIVTSLFVAGICPVIALAQSGTNSPQSGDDPPPLQLAKIIQGPSAKDVTWEALKGKLVVLEFWNIQCQPCIDAIPHLNEMIEHFKDKPVVFLSVSDDTEGHLHTFLKQHPLQSWLALDGPDNATERAFHLQGYGLIVLIDPQGKVAGLTLPAILQPKHLERILAGQPSDLPALNLASPSLPETSTNSPGQIKKEVK
jgi:peroxiredoxin